MCGIGTAAGPLPNIEGCDIANIDVLYIAASKASCDIRNKLAQKTANSE